MRTQPAFECVRKGRWNGNGIANANGSDFPIDLLSAEFRKAKRDREREGERQVSSGLWANILLSYRNAPERTGVSPKSPFPPSIGCGGNTPLYYVKMQNTAEKREIGKWQGNRGEFRGKMRKGSSRNNKLTITWINHSNNWCLVSGIYRKISPRRWRFEGLNWKLLSGQLSSSLICNGTCWQTQTINRPFGNFMKIMEIIWGE